MSESKEILLTVYHKKPGKKIITYKVQNLITNELLDEGTCEDTFASRNLYAKLLGIYGIDKVDLVHS